MKRSILVIVLASVGLCVEAQDWSDFVIPVSSGPGKSWQLQADFSDDFNYEGKTDAFSKNWNDTYFKNWGGPGLTEWNAGQTSVEGGHLVIKAARKPGTDKVHCGVVTSKTEVIYPIFMEARIKASNLELSSNFWMLSQNDQREIDVVEVYGGAAQTWFAQRMSTNFHVFVRDGGNRIISDFNDQTHNTLPNNALWRSSFHRYGVYWKSPTEITFYIDGEETPDGSWADVTMYDKDYTKTFMDKSQYVMDEPMFMILDTEDHSWRSDQGIIANDADLSNPSKNKMLVDWVRVYKPVEGVLSVDTQRSSVNVYPNPAAGYLNFENLIKGSYDVALHSITGVKVMDEEKILSDQQGLDISGFDPGVYFLQLQGNGVYLNTKVVVKK